MEEAVVFEVDWTKPEGRAAVLRLIQGRESTYATDIMEELWMGPDLTFEILDELAAEGKIEPAV